MSAPTTLAAPRTEFARIVDELTRRGFLTGIGTAAMLGLAACGSDGGASTDGRGTGTRSATRQVSSVHGPITVPVRQHLPPAVRLQRRARGARLARRRVDQARQCVMNVAVRTALPEKPYTAG